MRKMSVWASTLQALSHCYHDFLPHLFFIELCVGEINGKSVL